MKHQIELRFPKIFGKKKEDKSKVTTKVYVEDEIKEIPVQTIVGATLTVGLVAGYLLGHRSGVNKGGNTYIFKD